jgi:murein DD-endopeptidase MepM/ murein hydrolase activator NlpD
MANFDLNLSDLTDGGSFSRAFLNKSKNYDPSGVAKPLRTSESQGESKKSLTAWNVSDILQNNLTVKPEGLAYTAFNEQLSDVSQTVESFRVNGKNVNFPGKSYLLSFDIKNAADQVLDFNVTSGMSTSSGVTGTPASALDSSGRPAPPSSGFILSGAYRFPAHKTHYRDNPGSGTKAMDIGHSSGSPVFSPWEGKVAYIGYPNGGQVKKGATRDSSGGNSIVIVGDNGWSIYMAHFVNPPIVEIGDRVTKGQNVAHVGSTGRSSGPHVHLSVAQSSNYADVWNNPITYLWDFMKEIETQSALIRDVGEGGLGLRV